MRECPGENARGSFHDQTQLNISINGDGWLADLKRCGMAKKNMLHLKGPIRSNNQIYSVKATKHEGDITMIFDVYLKKMCY